MTNSILQPFSMLNEVNNNVCNIQIVEDDDFQWTDDEEDQGFYLNKTKLYELVILEHMQPEQNEG